MKRLLRVGLAAVALSGVSPVLAHGQPRAAGKAPAVEVYQNPT